MKSTTSEDGTSPEMHPMTDSPSGNPPAPAKAKHPSLMYTVPLLILTLLFGAYYLVRLNSSESTQDVSVRPVQAKMFVAIDSPSESASAISNEIIVSGRTLPGSTVLIYSDIDETILDSSQDGEFEGSLLIPPSGGLVRVLAVSPIGEEAEKTVSLKSANSMSYNASSDVLGKSDAPGQVKKSASSNNKTSESPTAAAAQIPAVSAAPKNKPVQTGKPVSAGQPQGIQLAPEKTEKIPKAIEVFMEKKTKSTKPEKIGSAKLREMLSTESSDSSKLHKGTIKKLEVSVASSGAQLKRHAVSGVITSIDGGTLTIAHQIRRDSLTKIYTNIDTVITSKNDASGSALLVGVRIAAVGEPVDGGILAKRVHIIPGKDIGIFNRLPVATDAGTKTTATPTPVSSVSGTLTPTVTETPESSATATPEPSGQSTESP